jgi:hypothetical protein
MPLIPCRECQKEISTNAKACPECGTPFPSRKEWNGTGFEWKSQKSFYGYPLIHIAFGRNIHGKFRIAKGVIAIGQFAIGIITFAQFGVGLLFGFGQFIFGLTAISQFAIALIFGVGQFATGYIAIGQFVLAYYGLAQLGYAKYIWSVNIKDPEAIAFFKTISSKVTAIIGKLINR